MVLIHDFTSNGYTGWIKHMTLMIKPFEEYNVISVNWQEGAEPPYVQAISNACVVALELKKLLDVLCNEFDLKLHQVHLVGHGVGAHIAGYIGKLTEGGIGRITGLDPSGPLFEAMPAAVRLDCSDAMYVEVLHTDGKGGHHQGTMVPIGHVDFYFNEGYSQPGCHSDSKSYNLLSVTRKNLKAGAILPACSHKRAFKYYIEAIAENKACSFLALPHNISKTSIVNCTTLKNDNVKCTTIGLNVDAVHLSQLKNAKFDIITRSDNPYCLNRYQMKVNVAKCPAADEKMKGYFSMSMTDVRGVTYNLTFEKILSKSKVILADKQTTFVTWSADPGIDEVEKIKLTWHFTSTFCFWCRNATCIAHLAFEHIRPFADDVGAPVINHFCPQNQRKYAVFYNNITSSALVPCKRKV